MKLEYNKRRFSMLMKSFNSLEQYGRGVNLEIHGVQEVGYENPYFLVEKKDSLRMGFVFKELFFKFNLVSFQVAFPTFFGY